MTRFELMVASLQGLPLPPLPALPGRLHLCVDDDDDAQTAELASMTAADLAEQIGLTRQGAEMRLKRAQQTGNWSGLLKPKTSHTSPAAPARRIDVHVAGKGAT